MIGPAKAPAPTMSCQACVRFAEVHWSGFQTATGCSKIRFSLPPAMASTA